MIPIEKVGKCIVFLRFHHRQTYGKHDASPQPSILRLLYHEIRKKFFSYSNNVKNPYFGQFFSKIHTFCLVAQINTVFIVLLHNDFCKKSPPAETLRAGFGKTAGLFVAEHFDIVGLEFFNALGGQGMAGSGKLCADLMGSSG